MQAAMTGTTSKHFKPQVMSGVLPTDAPQKSVSTAYLLLVSMGFIGAHKFYLGRPSIGALYAAGWVGFWVLFVGKANGLIALGTLFLVCFAVILDAMTLPAQVRAANDVVSGGAKDSVLSRPAFFIARDEGFDHRAADAAIERFLELSSSPQTESRRPASPKKRSFGRRT